MKILFVLIVLLVSLTMFSNVVDAQVATGGNFTLEKSVIGTGDAESSGTNFAVEGTIGQAVAGTNQQNGSYKFQSGFWTAQVFAPTAAEVSAGGKVSTANGIGIQNVRITMTGANGETRTIISSSFGYFRFDNVPAGSTYVFSVSVRRFTFSQPTQVRSIFDDTDDIFFVADN